jgi:glucan-binding YG repeat protein
MVHEINHALQLHNEKNNNVEYRNDSIQSCLMRIKMREASSVSSEFVFAYQCATNKETPNKDMLKDFKKKQSESYKKAMKYLGYSDKEVSKPLRKINIKEKNSTDIEIVRETIFKSYDFKKDEKKFYVDLVAYQLSKQGLKNLDEKKSKIDINEMVKVLFIRPNNKLKNNIKESDFINNNFMKLCDDCYKEITKSSSPKKSSQVKKVLNNFNVFKKDILHKNNIITKQIHKQERL